MTKKELLKKMQDFSNGCPLFEGREKCSLDDVAESELTIDDFYKIDTYYCVTFREMPKNFFLSSSSLTNLLEEFGKECIGVVVKFEKTVKTSGGKTFRPLKVVRLGE